VVLIDCAPNFVLTTKIAVVASDLLVIPARPDFLCVEGIQGLGLALQSLVAEYNENLRAARTKAVPPMTMPRAAVLFTMVQLRNDGPIDVHGKFINEVMAMQVPVFKNVIRDRSVAFADAGRHGVPTIMASAVPSEVRSDLHQVADELVGLLRRL
jgi:chromosome partitioning protein